jgi:probable rRNA maturation factor
VRAAAGRRARGPRRAKGGGHLVVAVTDERGRPLGVRGLAAWVRRAAPPRARGEVTIALVGDARIRALNRTYRRRDYATDVLSFPASDRASGRRARPASPRESANPKSTNPKSANPESRIPNPGSLGDIVIARGVARRQAREACHSVLTELKVLALHGLLHLLGYDHERDAGRMRRIERRLRQRAGLREGLIERAAPAPSRARRSERG